MFRYTNVLSAKKGLSDWLKEVDWVSWEDNPYVVVDPLNPSRLQYLNEAGYNKLQINCISGQLKLVLIASPESTPPSHERAYNSGGASLFRNVPGKGKLPFLKVLEGGEVDITPGPNAEATLLFIDYKTGKERKANLVDGVYLITPYTGTDRTYASVLQRMSRKFVSSLRVFLSPGGVKAVRVSRLVGNFQCLLMCWAERLFYLGNRDFSQSNRHTVQSIINTLCRLIRTNGVLYVTQYLKVTHYIINRYLSGE
jgi:hypothetical protein